jgi:acyl-CoA reductase-like NAD-dependent aldehyde dehydrogenase
VARFVSRGPVLAARVPLRPSVKEEEKFAMAYKTVNPFTGETVATFPDATDAEVDVALDTAEGAFQV